MDIKPDYSWMRWSEAQVKDLKPNMLLYRAEVELLYEQLEVLVATRPRPSTLHHYISGLETINNCWHEESNPHDCYRSTERLAERMVNSAFPPGFGAALGVGIRHSNMQSVHSNVNSELLAALEQSNKTVEQKCARIGELERLITEAGIPLK